MRKSKSTQLEKLQKSWGDVIKAFNEVTSDNARLWNTLVSVEWVGAPGGERMCMWCATLQIYGHADDCPRQVALYGEDWKEVTDE